MSILAVLYIGPVVPSATVPATVIVRLLLPPALIDAPVYETVFPTVALVPQLAVPPTAQLTDEMVIEIGTSSIISKPEASPRGPRWPQVPASFTPWCPS